MFLRPLAVIAIFVLAGRLDGQAPVREHLDKLNVLLAPCDAKHKACSTTCGSGADCEQCEKDYQDCRANLKVDVDLFNVRAPGTTDGTEPGMRQNDRAHEIDGCSVPGWAGPLLSVVDGHSGNVQDPCGGILGDTTFGASQGTGEAGVLANGEVVQDLPCNNHDICYQTCGSDKAECDDKMYDGMIAVCQKAYPGMKCPHIDVTCLLLPAKCTVVCALWYDEKMRCHKVAWEYKVGLATFGQSAYDERQEQYCEKVETE
jgi:hypothetical protein